MQKKGSPFNITLNGRKFLVTAGPTVEAIDPVRFISNHSTGKMGYAVAAELAARGARVVLVSGPVALETPARVERRIDVVSADDMYRRCVELWPEVDGAVMCAAVADYTPAEVSPVKIKKGGHGHGGRNVSSTERRPSPKAVEASREGDNADGELAGMSCSASSSRNDGNLVSLCCDGEHGDSNGGDVGSGRLSIELVATKDIAAELGRVKREGQILVGFALETDNEQANALDKLRRKRFDMIVLNSLRDAGAGFGGDTNRITIFGADGSALAYPLESKAAAAARIVDAIEGMV